MVRAKALGAIRHEQETIAETVFAPSRWDAAADHIYGAFDRGWVMTNLVGGNSPTFVIDHQGRTLFAVDGRLRPLPPFERLAGSSAVRELTSIAPETVDEARRMNRAKSLTISLGGQPVVVAAMPVTPASRGKPSPHGHPRLLVNMLLLDAERLAALGRTFDLPGLHWAPSGELYDPAFSVRILDNQPRRVIVRV